MIHCSPISRIFISNDRFSRLPPNIKDSIRRILLKRDLTLSQLKPLLNPNVKDYDLSDCSGFGTRSPKGYQSPLRGLFGQNWSP